MKGKAKFYRSASLIIALLVAVFAVGYAFAWLVDRRDSDFIIDGTSAGAYFDSGDGSETDPFVIANPTHMHNLAVLQNTGKFVDESGAPKQYFFEIKKTVAVIDMEGRFIPPIGNDKYPFIGDFNGNGKTVSNFTVTTDKDDLAYEYPMHSRETYEFSPAVGLFGMTGTESNLHNFIIENPEVVVADPLTDNTKYTTGGDANKVAGLAVGHVAGKCQSIGVRAVEDNKTALGLNATGYSTFNSILGELGENVTSSVTGGGHDANGGSGSSFGANFDMTSVLDRLYKIYKGKYGVDYKKGNTNEPLADSSPELPKISTANADPVPAAGAKIAFTADVGKSTYEGPDAAEVISDQNVGYFLGNENKFDSKKFTYKNKLTKPESDTGYIDWRTTVGVSGTNVPAWLYTYDVKTGWRTGNGCYSGEGFRPLTDAEFEELPDGIKNLLGNVGEQKTFTTMRISQDGVGTGNYGQADAKQQWSYHGQISWMGTVYGDGFNSSDGYAVDADGNYIVGDYGKLIPFNEYSGGIALPNNAIWFKPAQVGKFRFVMYAQSDGDGFILNKITRNNASLGDPFKVDPSKNGADVESEVILQQIIPSAVLLYYEYDLSEEEYASGNVEFMLQKTGSGGAHFVYLDVGASASDDVSAVVPEKSVSAVDFIYDGVEIEQADEVIGIGNFIVNTSGDKALYEASKTSIYFENTQKVLQVVYVRLHERSDQKTIHLTNFTSDTIKNSDMRATFANYVLPDGIQGGSGSNTGGGTVTPTPDPDPPTPEPVPVTSVTIDGGDFELEANGTKKLNVTVLPSNADNTAVVWSSSDDNVATVDQNGNVTAKELTAGGTAVITATAADGSGISASVKVTVKAVVVEPDPPAPIEPVTGGITAWGTGTITSGTVVLQSTPDGVFAVTSAASLSGKDSGGSVQVSAGNALTFDLAKGYVYTIKIKLGSSGSSARTVTLNGESYATAASSSLSGFVEQTWTIDVDDASATSYILSVSGGNAKIGEIQIIATPKT